NIPQRSNRPDEAVSSYCAKATLVEVTVDNIPDTDGEDKLSIHDFNLKSVPPHQDGRTGVIYRESSDDSFQSDLLKKGELQMLKLNFLPDNATSSRGWIVFSVAENADNKGTQLLYAKSGETLASVDLPDNN